MTLSRKTLAAVLSLVIAFSLASCAGHPSESEPTGPSVTGPDASNENPEPPMVHLSDLTSVEFARLMGHGNNLYNTMEACNAGSRIPNREPAVYETMWGQPITTQAIITGMREAGFRTLRIPVAWTNAMDFESGDLAIDDDYLERVEEIINYALNEDMFVVVNAHWDHGWWSLFGHPDQKQREFALEMFISMWTQIAERYGKYDLHLIFEAANEEWGDRFNDETPFSPTGGTLTEDERYELITFLGEVFIDIIRKSGGNNTNRFLLIPGYNTDVEKTVDVRFIMPIDPAGKTLLKVHYYTPWSYSGGPSSVSAWGTTQDIEHMNNLLGSLTKFTNIGYGVVFGEWGVLDNEGEDRLAFTTNFLDNCDLYGFATLLWDTPGGYSRTEHKIINPEIAELFLNRNQMLASLTTDEVTQRAEENMAWTLRKAENRPTFVLGNDQAIAWIMFASNDWGMSYSVGDIYNPLSRTDGIQAVDVEISGAGNYEVSLDFTGTQDGFANNMFFSAVGIANGELLFPGYYINITEILVNGEPAVLTGKSYTTSDDGITTRTNLYNDWVRSLPVDARVSDGDLTNASPIPLENYIEGRIETIVVTFEFIGG